MKPLRHPRPLALAVLASLVTVGPARAWDSICYQWADPTQPVAHLGVPFGRGCEGLLSARGRWRDPEWQLDEHRALLAYAIAHAGLPLDLLDTVVLAVPTPAVDVDIGADEPAPTLRSLPLDSTSAIDRLVKRGFSIDELAQLPDFSYSLADWADGNERCPLGAGLGDAIQCHTFATHLGALNSSHFPPQSDWWYAWMHGLAITRAGECRQMRGDAWHGFTDEGAAQEFDARWHDVWRECEAEAMALEAVAQHYLQDSWSSGHMWQRWGSTDLGQFPALESTVEGDAANAWNAGNRSLKVAELVALFSGTIHGSDVALFEESLKTWYLPHTTRDAVCYPANASLGYLQNGDLVPAAGDMHLHDVLGEAASQATFDCSGSTDHDCGAESLHDQYDSPVTPSSHTSSQELAPQLAHLLGCASASVAEVYALLADSGSFGDPTFGAAGPPPLPPGDCTAPRLSPHTLAQGIESSPMITAKAFLGLGHGAVLGVKALPSDVDGAAFKSYDEARRIFQLMAKYAPTSRGAADLSWPAIEYYEMLSGDLGFQVEHFVEPAGELTFLGVKRNGLYPPSPGPQPTLADPPLPWGDPGNPEALAPDTPEQALASTFNRAHAPLWCARTTAADLDVLIDRTVERLGRTDTALSPEEDQQAKESMCAACIEVVSRHIRPSCGKSLCEALHPGSFTFDGAGDPTLEAEARCGCAVTRGFIARPVSDTAPQGWGKPCADAGGTPINPPLGSIGGAQPFNALWQRSDDPTWSVTRNFEPSVGTTSPWHTTTYGNLDWVYERDGKLAGYVSWKGPHGRSAPEPPWESLPTGAEGYVAVATADARRFYAYRGTKVFLDGKVLYDFAPSVGYVSGAAIRHDGFDRYLLVATTNFAEDVDRLWSIRLDTPVPIAVSAGTVALPSGYRFAPTLRANSYFCNESATECATVIAAVRGEHFTQGFPRTETWGGVDYVTPNEVSGDADVPVAVLCTVAWSPTVGSVTCTPGASTAATSSRSEDATSAHGGEVGEWVSRNAYSFEVNNVPVAVDYRGNQQVKLYRSVAVRESSSSSDAFSTGCAFFGGCGAPYQRADGTSSAHRIDVLASNSRSIYGEVTQSGESHVSLDYPSMVAHGDSRTDEVVVVNDVLYVDLRHDEYLYRQTTTTIHSVSQGAGNAGTSTASTTISEKLFHNSTVLSERTRTMAIGPTPIDWDANLWSSCRSCSFFDSLLTAVHAHTTGAGPRESTTVDFSTPVVTAVNLQQGLESYSVAPEFAVAADGACMFSVPMPTFGPDGPTVPIVYYNQFSGGSPTTAFGIEGDHPRLEDIGLYAHGAPADPGW